MMRITNTSLFVQVFGDLRINPGDSGSLNPEWKPKIQSLVDSKAIRIVGSQADPKPVSLEKAPSFFQAISQIDSQADSPETESQADSPKADSQAEAYASSHYQTRIKFVKNCFDLHVLEVIQAHEKHEKIQKLVGDQISHLKANSEENS